MRRIKSWLTGGAALGLALISGPARQAHGAPPDAVEAFRLELRANPSDPAEWEARLRRRAAELVSLKEVREALQLAEWRSASGDNRVQGVENRLRVELMTRLVEGYRQTLKSADTKSAAQLLERLDEVTRGQNASVSILEACAELLPELERQVRTGEPEARSSGLRVIGRLPTKQETVLGVLKELASPNQPADTRFLASEALESQVRLKTRTGEKSKSSYEPMGGFAQAVAPIIRMLAGDSQARVRRLAMNSSHMVATGLNTSLAEPIIAPAGTDAGLFLSQSPIHADQRMMLAAVRDLMAATGSALRDPDAGVRVLAQKFFDEAARARLAWNALPGHSGDDPLREGLKAILPTLIEAIRDPDPRVRRATIDVLESMGPDATPAAVALGEALGDQDAFVRWAAVRSLSSLGGEATKAALPRLRNLSSDPDTDVREAAEAAVRRLEPRR